MLKSLLLAAALTAAGSLIAVASPVPTGQPGVADARVVRVQHVRDKGRARSPHRNSVIILSMGVLASLIAAAIAAD